MIVKRATVFGVTHRNPSITQLHELLELVDLSQSTRLLKNQVSIFLVDRYFSMRQPQYSIQGKPIPQGDISVLLLLFLHVLFLD